MDENIKKALQEHYDELRKQGTETWEEIHKRLLSLEERNTAPDDQKVQDLETRLGEKEREIESVKEEIRLLKAHPSVADNGDSLAVVKPDFKGMFIGDLERARKVIGTGQVRAIDTSLFVGDAGELSIETADAFIDLIVSETTTLSRITTRRMNGPSAALDELRVSSRNLVAATEGTAPAVADSVSLARRSLATVEGIWAEDITLSFLEDNIEKQGVEAHIAAVLARKFGTDLNDLAINGDSTTGTFLVINDGFIKLALADSDVTDVDLTAETTAAACLSSVLKGMPSRFLPITDLAFIGPVGFCQNYADEFAARETSSGDQVFLNGFPALRYFGRPVIPEPHFSETTAGVESNEKIMFTSLSRLVNGIQRNFRVDAQWQGRKRVVEYTLTARVDAEYVSGEIISLGDNLPAALQ